MNERKEELANRLSVVRLRTLNLLHQVPDELLKIRVHDFYSPIGWHFGHVGRTEEFWARTNAMGLPPSDEHLSFLFADTPENPKDNRVNIPDRSGIIEYLQETRENVLAALHAADLESEQPLLTNGFAWEFALLHECQHQETIYEMLCLLQKSMNSQADQTPLDHPGWVPKKTEMQFEQYEAVRTSIGTNDFAAYDNERLRHEIELPSFSLAARLVTCGDWMEFTQSGGYRERDHWSKEGWRWRESESVERPFYWLETEIPMTYCPLGIRYLRADEPVFAISWHEASAFARWAGFRLPTEFEWEHAASTFQQNHPENRPPMLAPEPVQFESRLDGMFGSVWQWTSSLFQAYPGFQAFPYAGYSEDHMDGRHYCCRGGSWATQDPILRPTFRNWYVPTYRQGFLGMRCAK